MAGTEKPYGVLDPRAGEKRFRLSRYPPSEDLGVFVERYWIVDWDLRGREPYVQETLPHPCVNLVFDRRRSGIFGVVSKGRFSYVLAGKGRVFGVKFRPGAFYPFLNSPVSTLTDRTVGVREVFGPVGDAMEEAILSLEDEGEMAETAETFLRGRLPGREETAALAGRIVNRIMADGGIVGVEDVAEGFGMSKRTLQRVFHRYVGVGPKWVIRRYRLHEAAARLADAGTVNLPDLALDLGYFDQSHFIKDFKALVGKTPAQYARNATSDI